MTGPETPREPESFLTRIRRALVNPETVRYLVVGILTTAVSLASYEIARLLGVSIQPANVISWICAVTFAFFTNKFIVFQSRDASARVLLPEMVRFYGGRLFSLALEAAVLWLLADVLHIHDFIAKCAGQVIVFVTNYLLSKFLVFRQKRS